MNLIGIPVNEVESVWHVVEPLIQRALDHSPGDYSIESIHEGILDKTYQLWVFYNGKIKAALVTTIYETPENRVACLMLLGGEDHESWLKLIHPLEAWAKGMNCHALEIYGRRAWGKLLPDFKNSFSVFRKWVQS